MYGSFRKIENELLKDVVVGEEYVCVFILDFKVELNYYVVFCEFDCLKFILEYFKLYVVESRMVINS